MSKKGLFTLLRGIGLVLVISLIVSGCYQAPAPTPAPKPPATTPTPPPAPAPPTTAPAPAPTPAPPATAPAPASGTVHQVTIKNFAFSPKQITIKVGDTVTWTNQDSAPHTVTGSGFDSSNLANGQSWSYPFNVAGSFSYKCTIHPSMQGLVTMESGGQNGGQSDAYNY